MKRNQRTILIPLSFMLLLFFMQAVFAGEKKQNDPKVDKNIPCIGCETESCGATASTWKELFKKFFSAKNTKETLKKGGEK